MSSTALVLGGSGQIGVAVRRALREAGWRVTSASRGHRHPTADGDELVVLDREDTDALARAAQGVDLLVDTVAFTPDHARQLLQLDVGSLVVISTAAAYLGSNGTYLDVVSDAASFPEYPVPIEEDWPTVDNTEPTYSPQKAAMERVLLDGALPVSVLRAGAVHGPESPALREWFFIKRALDGRRRVRLPWGGEGRFHPAATTNLAALVLACATTAGTRVLNAVDDECPSDAEIARGIFDRMGHDAEVVTVPGAPGEGMTGSPWGIPKPFVLSMARAHDEVGYVAPLTWSEAVQLDIDWAVRAVRDAESAGRSWRVVFPDLLDWGADAWFDYGVEDRASSGGGPSTDNP